MHHPYSTILFLDVLAPNAFLHCRKAKANLEADLVADLGEVTEDKHPFSTGEDTDLGNIDEEALALLIEDDLPNDVSDTEQFDLEDLAALGRSPVETKSFEELMADDCSPVEEDRAELSEAEDIPELSYAGEMEGYRQGEGRPDAVPTRKTKTARGK